MLRAALLDWKLTWRPLGKWWAIVLLAWCLLAWLQEPTFLREYGIQILWDAGAAGSVVGFVIFGLTWSNSREAAEWIPFTRGNPLRIVLVSAAALEFQALVAVCLVASICFTVDKISGTASPGGSPLLFIAKLLVVALPLSCLAPGIAACRLPTVATVMVWVALLALDASLARTLSIAPAESFSANFAPALLGAAGSVCLSVSLLRMQQRPARH
jgi:hypothetical protein